MERLIRFHMGQMATLMELLSNHDCHKSASAEDGCECDQLTEEAESEEDECDDEECEYCGGEGEVSTDCMDSDGNIERGVGTQKCICRIEAEDDYDPELHGND